MPPAAMTPMPYPAGKPCRWRMAAWLPARPGSAAAAPPLNPTTQLRMARPSTACMRRVMVVVASIA